MDAHLTIPMKCPSCSTTANTVQMDSLNLDICPSCSGIWFDRDELMHFTHRLESHHLPTIELPKETPGSATEPMNARLAHAIPPTDCPKCYRETKRRIYAGNSNLWIDTCEHCSGAWFDGGEVRMLLAMFKENPTEEALVRAVAEYGREKIQEDEDAKLIPLMVHAGFAGMLGSSIVPIVRVLGLLLDRELRAQSETHEK